MIAGGLQGIPASQLALVWATIVPDIKRALAYGGGLWSVHDVADDLNQERKQLFVTPDLKLVVITEIVRYPQKLALNIFLTAGRLPDDWRFLLASIEGWAKVKGCQIVRFQGRRGWERKLPDYAPGLTFFTKEL